MTPCSAEWGTTCWFGSVGQGSTTFDGGPGDDRVVLLGGPRADVMRVTAAAGGVHVSWHARTQAELSMKAVEHLDIRTGPGRDVRADPVAVAGL